MSGNSPPVIPEVSNETDFASLMARDVLLQFLYHRNRKFAPSMPFEWFPGFLIAGSLSHVFGRCWLDELLGISMNYYELF